MGYRHYFLTVDIEKVNEFQRYLRVLESLS